jgi:predicted secreted hydrolase
MIGGGGHDRLTAASEAAGFGLDLTLDAGGLPALLHGQDGWVDFGPAGGSYYYSRPRLRVSGTLTLGGTALPVSGLAWFDHQWGDFIAVGGGWDWFAVDLDDGSALTLSLVRDVEGRQALAYGTLMQPDGTAVHLAAADFAVQVLDHWTSPHTGALYPAGWRLTVPGRGLVITLRPTVADQELDTRASTGVIYWEGSQVVSATRDGLPLGGQAYVELTGYASAASR